MAQPNRPLRPPGPGYDRRRFLRNAALGVGGLATGSLLEACGSSASSTTTTTLASGATTTTNAMSSLIAAAKSEGMLNLIADPYNWANYGTQDTPNTVIGEFHSLYGIQCPVVNPEGTSAEELAAIVADKNTSKAPDAVDVSLAIAAQGAQQNLFAPYKVSTWDDIPASMKDPNGVWTGDYYGVISFGTNTKVVKNPPKTWSDLEKPEYKGQVSIDGSPAAAGDALGAIFAAALAHGGSLDNVMPGIEFFAHLKSIGNFNPVDCYSANIVSGETPIAIIWDYLNIGYRKLYPNIKYAVTLPTTGKYGGIYCQAINATAPHPKAAELWLEYLYSDQGQLEYLAGYVHPARYEALVTSGKIPSSLSAELAAAGVPTAAEYAGTKFATLDQITKASNLCVANWDKMVGGV
ncbi:MAG: ABC transporter substrate-binding protein [Acidimicrobiales bacterium]